MYAYTYIYTHVCIHTETHTYVCTCKSFGSHMSVMQNLVPVYSSPKMQRQSELLPIDPRMLPASPYQVGLAPQPRPLNTIFRNLRCNNPYLGSRSCLRIGFQRRWAGLQGLRLQARKHLKQQTLQEPLSTRSYISHGVQFWQPLGAYARFLTSSAMGSSTWQKRIPGRPSSWHPP